MLLEISVIKATNRDLIVTKGSIYIYTHIVKGFIMIYLSLLSYKGYSEGIYLIIRGLLTYK